MPLLCLIGWCTPVCGQGEPAKAAADLPEFNTALTWTCLTSRLSYEIAVRKPERRAPVAQVKKDIQQFVLQPRKESDPGVEFLKKHQQSVEALFDSLGLIGGGLGEFLYHTNSMVPLSFSRKGDATVLMVEGVFSSAIYNTQTTTSKSRAAKIISSMILPSLKNFSTAFPTPEVQHFGMSVVYGSKDFADTTSVLNRKPEVVVLVVGRDKCKQFVDAAITEDELVKSADIYQADRDMTTGFKKITVTLE